MVSVIYISLCALLIVKLSWNVVKLRRAKRVSLGDGDDKELRKAIAAQENATEYIPTTLMLLVALEYNAAPIGIVHLFGMVFVIGRLLHAIGVESHFKWRVRGMQLTYFAMLGLVIANLVYLPYEKLI